MSAADDFSRLAFDFAVAAVDAEQQTDPVLAQLAAGRAARLWILTEQARTSLLAGDLLQRIADVAQGLPEVGEGDIGLPTLGGAGSAAGVPLGGDGSTLPGGIAHENSSSVEDPDRLENGRVSADTVEGASDAAAVTPPAAAPFVPAHLAVDARAVAADLAWRARL